jgi:hypothetical protein
MTLEQRGCAPTEMAHQLRPVFSCLGDAEGWKMRKTFKSRSEDVSGISK